MSHVLYVSINQGSALDQVLKSLGRRAVGLFYAVGWCGFGRVDADGSVTGADGKPLSLLNCYEARVFDGEVELRWWNDPQKSQHRAALLSEKQIALSGWREEQPISIETKLCQSYLLWGQATAISSEIESSWTRLTTARIGRIDVPATGGERFVLKTVEYLAEVVDGNVAVVDERLCELVKYEEDKS